MKIGILVAMEEEIRRLMEVISTNSVKTIAKQTFYDGTIYNQPVTIVQAGIGKVNAAIATSLLIQEFGVELVVNTGSAGGIGKGMAIGDLVIANELAYNDADNRGFGYTYGQIPQMEPRFKSNKNIRMKLEKIATEKNWYVHQGLIVSGDSFISSTEQISHIKEYFPNALATEMEGTAVAQTCEQFEVPFAVIRAISDTADEEANITFDEFVLLAGKQSAELILEFIKDFL